MNNASWDEYYVVLSDIFLTHQSEWSTWRWCNTADKLAVARCFSHNPFRRSRCTGRYCPYRDTVGRGDVQKAMFTLMMVWSYVLAIICVRCGVSPERLWVRRRGTQGRTTGWLRICLRKSTDQSPRPGSEPADLSGKPHESKIKFIC